MLIKRVITAVLGISWLIFAVQNGSWYFNGTIAVMILVAWYEFTSMLSKKGINVFWLTGLTGSLLLLFCAWLGNEQEQIFLFIIFSFLFFLRLFLGSKSFNIENVFYSIAGLFYIGFLFMHFVLLRFLSSEVLVKYLWGEMSLGIVCLWLTFIAVWATDTFAFFIGSAFGRTKLCSNISPNKSWEGALGGFLGSILVMYILTFLVELPLVKVLALGAVASVAGQLGDLAESALKRFCEVKDSGRIMPGHGGVLDRMDSLLFAIPLTYYYVLFFLL